MAKPPDLQDLAKQYLDLWQDQLGGVPKDPQTVEIMAQTMELMNSGAQAFANLATAAQNSMNTGATDQGDNDGNAPPATRNFPVSPARQSRPPFGATERRGFSITRPETRTPARFWSCRP